MPQDMNFDLPEPTGTSPDLDSARSRNLAWVRRLGPVRGAEALEWYTSWDMPLLAAVGFPHARGAELDLCADTMAFFFVFDDLFDDPPGRDGAATARVCQAMIDIVHGAPLPTGHDAYAAAYADVWHGSIRGAPPGWAARAACEWEYYFAAHPHEALNRGRGTPSDMEHYLQVRRGVAGTALPLSLGELAAGITIPATAFHSPQLRIMRDIAIDVSLMCNDVCSLEKEEALGDMDNLVLVVGHERGCARDEALAAARAIVDRHCARFRELARLVPAIAENLGLNPAQRAAVRTYIDVMTAWMSGYHAWQRRTARYTPPDARP